MKRLFLIISLIFMCISFFIPAYAQMPNYTELTGLLIDLDGWDAEQATGMNMSGPMGEMVNALREYEKDGSTISAQIIVGAAAQGTWAPFASGFTMDSPEIFVKSMTVSEYPVGINHDKKGKTGAVVVFLNTTGSPGIFVLSYEGISWEDALKLSQEFSWSTIKKALE